MAELLSPLQRRLGTICFGFAAAVILFTFQSNVIRQQGRTESKVNAAVVGNASQDTVQMSLSELNALRDEVARLKAQLAANRPGAPGGEGESPTPDASTAAGGAESPAEAAAEASPESQLQAEPESPPLPSAVALAGLAATEPDAEQEYWEDITEEFSLAVLLEDFLPLFPNIPRLAEMQFGMRQIYGDPLCVGDWRFVQNTKAAPPAFCRRKNRQPNMTLDPAVEFDQFALERIMLGKWMKYPGSCWGTEAGCKERAEVVVVPSVILHYFAAHGFTWPTYDLVVGPADRQLYSTFWRTLRERYYKPAQKNPLIVVHFPFVYDRLPGKYMLETLAEQPIGFANLVIIAGIESNMDDTVRELFSRSWHSAVDQELLCRKSQQRGRCAGPVLVAMPYPTSIVEPVSFLKTEGAFDGIYGEPRVIAISMLVSMKKGGDNNWIRSVLHNNIMQNGGELNRYQNPNKDLQKVLKDVEYVVICTDPDRKKDNCGLGEVVYSLWELAANSVFCVEPAGDTMTRSHFYVAVLSGCVPVILDGGVSKFLPSEETSWAWRSTDEDARIPGLFVNYSSFALVYNATEMKETGHDLAQELLELQRTQPDLVLSKRRALHKVAPRMRYSMQQGCLAGNADDLHCKDAFVYFQHIVAKTSEIGTSGSSRITLDRVGVAGVSGEGMSLRSWLPAVNVARLQDLFEDLNGTTTLEALNMSMTDLYSRTICLNDWRFVSSTKFAPRGFCRHISGQPERSIDTGIEFDQYALERIMLGKWLSSPLRCRTEACTPHADVVVVPSVVLYAFVKRGFSWTTYSSITLEDCRKYWNIIRKKHFKEKTSSKILRYTPLIIVHFPFPWDQEPAKNFLHALFEAPTSFANRVVIAGVENSLQSNETARFLPKWPDSTHTQLHCRAQKRKKFMPGVSQVSACGGPLLVSLPYPTSILESVHHIKDNPPFMSSTPRSIAISMLASSGKGGDAQWIRKLLLQQMARNGAQVMPYEHPNKNLMRVLDGAKYAMLCAGGRHEPGCGLNKPYTMWEVATRSVFCLEPAGSALTRSHFYMAILSGCIPVVFDGGHDRYDRGIRTGWAWRRDGGNNRTLKLRNKRIGPELDIHFANYSTVALVFNASKLRYKRPPPSPTAWLAAAQALEGLSGVAGPGLQPQALSGNQSQGPQAGLGSTQSVLSEADRSRRYPGQSGRAQRGPQLPTEQREQPDWLARAGLPTLPPEPKMPAKGEARAQPVLSGLDALLNSLGGQGLTDPVPAAVPPKADRGAPPRRLAADADAGAADVDDEEAVPSNEGPVEEATHWGGDVHSGYGASGGSEELDVVSHLLNLIESEPDRVEELKKGVDAVAPKMRYAEATCSEHCFHEGTSCTASCRDAFSHFESLVVLVADVNRQV